MRCPVCREERSGDYCKVCAMRSRLRRAEKVNRDTYMALPKDIRKRYLSIERGEGRPYPKKGTDEENEEWALQELERLIRETRIDTERMKRGLSETDQRGVSREGFEAQGGTPADRR